MSEIKAVRYYKLNQVKVDEACQEMFDLILNIASDGKISDIKRQLEALVKEVKEKMQ